MKICLIPAMLIACSACNAPSTASKAPVADEEQTRQVLQHHWEAFQANNLEETMADYTDESILITPDKTFRGLDEIKENFVGAFTAFPKDSSTLTLNKSIVVNEVGYIIWEASTPSFNLTFGTDTFVILDGKIVSQTYAGVASPKAVN